MSSRFLILSMKVCGHLKPLRIETRMQRLFSANTMASTATSAAQGPESGNQIHQKIAGRQRFYKVVGVKESADGKGFHVTLDGSSIPPSANYLLSVLSTLMYTHLNVHTGKVLKTPGLCMRHAYLRIFLWIQWSEHVALSVRIQHVILLSCLIVISQLYSRVNGIFRQISDVE